jgi:undecaprenyl-diphosphatase
MLRAGCPVYHRDRMPLLHLVVLAALQGAAEALPVSPSGHAAVARLWFSPGAAGPGLEVVLHLATALALGIAARKRLLSALGEGVRAIARPALFQASPGARDAVVLVIASAVSLGTASLVAPRVARLHDAPLATGLGLLVTGVGLASTRWTRRGRPGAHRGTTTATRETPLLLLAALVGVAHGLAVFPGASRVGAALIVLLWLGARPSRAAPLALALTLPSLFFASARGLARGADLSRIDPGDLALGLVVTFLAALLASGVLSRLVERRRLPILALWLVPLGLAWLAYARALPAPGA